MLLIRGLLEFQAEYADYLIEDEYAVEVLVLKEYPDLLPKIFEVGHRIPRQFHHLLDDSLCLGAPLAVKQKFLKDPTLVGFIGNCVVPYLYSFSYKSRFGRMPFGELSHGGIGILEHYQELFGLNDRRRVLEFIQILATDSYRDDVKCPCRSGKQGHDCHGKIILEIRSLQSPAEFQADLNSIVNSIEIAAQRSYYPYFLSDATSIAEILGRKTNFLRS